MDKNETAKGTTTCMTAWHDELAEVACKKMDLDSELILRSDSVFGEVLVVFCFFTQMKGTLLQGRFWFWLTLL
jgi:hypothetical protein